MIGEKTAEEVKIAIGSALSLEEELDKEVRGRDQVSGLPKTIQVTSGEITEAIAEPMASIVGVVKNVLEKTPPELASDVIDRGIVMTGGGSLLRGIDRLLTKETGVPCYVADNPIACVALGAGKALDNYEVIKRSLPAY
jgi:rod shape-determining protein MreB